MSLERPSDVTGEFARFSVSSDFRNVPHEVQAQALLRILDFTGVAIRALRESESDPSIRHVLRTVHGRGTATALGEPKGWAPAHAAFLNAALAHSLDFDDTHEAGSVHPGVVVIPAALAVAEQMDCSGAELIAAVVVGYELTCRLAAALGPRSLYSRGFHPTSIAGVVGAALTAARLLRLSGHEAETAISIAAGHAAGSMQFFDNGAWNKRLHPGQAAHDGILAAQLAAAGFRGAEAALEGRLGLFRAYSDEGRPSEAIKGLGEEWELPRASVKPYPSCRYAHGPLDAILELVGRHRIVASEVIDVGVHLSATALALIGEPVDAKRRPVNVVDGQFSMHFLAAAAILHRRFGWDEYGLLDTHEVRGLMQRIAVSEDARATAAYPDSWISRVVIRTNRGTFELERLGARGGEDDPFSPSDVAAKFQALAIPVLGRTVAAELQSSLLTLGTISKIRPIVARLRKLCCESAVMRVGVSTK